MTLADDIKACTKCSLFNQRTNAVPADVGSKYQLGGIAIFVDAPGVEEDKAGKQMQGRPGKLLDALLADSGLSRDEVVVLSRVRCKPVRNRLQDFPDASVACDEWVKKELDEYNPTVVVLAGNIAMRSVFGATVGISNVRGSVRQTGSDYMYGSRVWVPCFHPFAALRNSEIKQTIISDLRLAKELHAESSTQ